MFDDGDNLWWLLAFGLGCGLLGYILGGGKFFG